MIDDAEMFGLAPVHRLDPYGGLEAEWVDEIDIPDETPPMALGPVLPDEGSAVLFGMGESRKSIIAQVVATSLATGAEIVPGWTPTVTGPVMWLDYENSRRRFARRQRLLGPAPILYVGCHRPIWDDAAYLAKLASDHGVVACIVDSIVAATAGGALSTKDAEAASEYFAAVNQISTRSISIAHITKGDGDATMPYGSVFFHNLARLTWRAKVDEHDRVTLTNHKHTDGDRLPSATLAFDFDERLTVRHVSPQLTTVVLVELVDRPMTRDEIVTAAKDAGYTVGRSWLTELLATAVREGKLDKPERGLYDRHSTGIRPLEAFGR